MEIETLRTRLRPWRRTDADALAAMHADPEVMHDYGGPLSRTDSDTKLDRYAATYDQHGFCRWAVETHEGAFLGYAGIMPSPHAPSARAAFQNWVAFGSPRLGTRLCHRSCTGGALPCVHPCRID
jgi:RimJ/RimL family protein N-acetyltransferase